jgi:3-methyladenine DNA glycosylase AlkD
MNVLNNGPAPLLSSDIIRIVSETTDQNTEKLRSIRREFSKQIKALSSVSVYRIAFELLDQPQFVFHWIAFELIAHHKASSENLDLKKLEKLGDGIDSWYSVDAFACFLSGPAWREKQITDTAIHRWAKSKNKWWRRAALVSTVPLNNTARGGAGDAKRTLAVCDILLDDGDDMVVKALSWALRELSKKDPVSVQKFVHRYRTRLAPRVVREVTNKLSTGLKNPRGPKIN